MDTFVVPKNPFATMCDSENVFTRTLNMAIVFVVLCQGKKTFWSHLRASWISICGNRPGIYSFYSICTVYCWERNCTITVVQLLKSVLFTKLNFWNWVQRKLPHTAPSFFILFTYFWIGTILCTFKEDNWHFHTHNSLRFHSVSCFSCNVLVNLQLSFLAFLNIATSGG